MFILGLRAWYTVKAQAMFVEEITLNLSIFLPVPHSTISNYLYDTLVWASTHLLKLKVSHYSSHDELVNIMFSEYIRKKKKKPGAEMEKAMAPHSSTLAWKIP